MLQIIHTISCNKMLLFVLFFLNVSMIFGQSTPPNIIYILADDMGYGDVSAYNPNTPIKTPNIDAIAKQGMRFTDAHSGSAVCTPTRYGILTGRYAWRSKLQNGVLWSYDSALITPNRLTVAKLLKQQGYKTACIGKWHLGLNWSTDANGTINHLNKITGGPNDLGFDYSYIITASLDIPPYVYFENQQLTTTSLDSIQANSGLGFWRSGVIAKDFEHTQVLDKTTQKAVDFIQQNSAHPFFLYLPLSAPHTPILPTAAFAGKSKTNEYGDFLIMTDAMVGRILKALKDRGIEKNTLLIFTSDNGASPTSDFKALKAAGHDPSYSLRGTKSDIYEGGHRIPFIAQWPNAIQSGTINNSVICLTDLMATCADLTHSTLAANTAEDSYSLVPLLAPKRNKVYQRTATVHHSIDGKFAIRKGKWKLIFANGSGGWSSPTEKQALKEQLPPIQLYDLSTDQKENFNIASKFPEVVQQLSRELHSIIVNGRSTKGAIQPNDPALKFNPMEIINNN